MASTSAITTMALPAVSTGRKSALVGRDTFFCPLKPNLKDGTCRSVNQLPVCAASGSMKEKAIAGLTAAALAAALVLPDMAEAAQPGISPSLKNFLLSILSGGVVLAVLIGAVIGVANFDPVKRK